MDSVETAEEIYYQYRKDAGVESPQFEELPPQQVTAWINVVESLVEKLKTPTKKKKVL